MIELMASCIATCMIASSRACGGPTANGTFNSCRFQSLTTSASACGTEPNRIIAEPIANRASFVLVRVVTFHLLVGGNTPSGRLVTTSPEVVGVAWIGDVDSVECESAGESLIPNH